MKEVALLPVSSGSGTKSFRESHDDVSRALRYCMGHAEVSGFRYIALLDCGHQGLKPVLLQAEEKIISSEKPIAAFQIEVLQEGSFVWKDGDLVEGGILLKPVLPEMVMGDYWIWKGEEFSEHCCPICGFPFTTGVRSPEGDGDDWDVLPHCSNSRCKKVAANEKDPYLDCRRGELLQKMAPLTLHSAAWAFDTLGHNALNSQRKSYWAVNLHEYWHREAINKIPFEGIISRLLTWGWVPREDGLWVKALDPLGIAGSWCWKTMDAFEEDLKGEFLKAGEGLLEMIRKYKSYDEINPFPAAQDGKLRIEHYGLFVADRLCLKGALKIITYEIKSNVYGNGTVSLPYEYDLMRPDGRPVCIWKGLSYTAWVKYGSSRNSVSPPEDFVRVDGPHITFWGPDGDVQGEIYFWAGHGTLLSRSGGPALWVKHNGEILLSVHAKDGLLHREDGPAVEEADRGALVSVQKIYGVEGRVMAEEEWRREMALRRLSRSIQQNKRLSL